MICGSIALRNAYLRIRLWRGAERLQVAAVIRLQLVDDHVPHPDRPAAEHDEEERQERQDPVGDEVREEQPGQRRLEVEAVAARRAGRSGRLIDSRNDRTSASHMYGVAVRM